MAASERTARCSYFKSCGSESKSSNAANLAFFQKKDAWSREAREMCTCGYHEMAHTPETMAKPHVANVLKIKGLDSKTHVFEARGALPHDEYYCGCRGWD